MPDPAPAITGLAALDMANQYNQADFRAWARRAHSPGGCAQPVHLRGRVTQHDPLTGQILRHYSTARKPGGALRVACETRRASRRPAWADTYQLGKDVPSSVSTHPAAFVTLPTLP